MNTTLPHIRVHRPFYQRMGRWPRRYSVAFVIVAAPLGWWAFYEFLSMLW